MLGRAREVGSVHLVVRWRPGKGNPEDDPLRKQYELWWRPGVGREKWEGSAPSLKREENDGIEFYRFDPASNQVASYVETEKQPDYRAFDLASFAKDYMDKPTRFEQPSTTRIVATNGGGWSRMVFTLDAKTGLPTRAEKQFPRSKTWLESG